MSPQAMPGDAGGCESHGGGGRLWPLTGVAFFMIGVENLMFYINKIMFYGERLVHP